MKKNFRKLSYHEMKNLAPGEPVFTPTGQEAKFVEFDKKTYAFKVVFPDSSEKSYLQLYVPAKTDA